MRRREQSPRRLLAHDETRIRSFEQKGGIRLPADELAHGERTVKFRHVVAQIVIEASLVEAMILAYRADAIFERHSPLPLAPSPFRIGGTRITHLFSSSCAPLQKGEGLGERGHFALPVVCGSCDCCGSSLQL